MKEVYVRSLLALKMQDISCISICFFFTQLSKEEYYGTRCTQTAYKCQRFFD